jgi:hypothetical protein
VQLTQEQIDMGMIKVESGSGGMMGSMGPPQAVAREDYVDMFKSRGGRGRGAFSVSGRKRKDRDSDGEDMGGSIGRKKSRG